MHYLSLVVSLLLSELQWVHPHGLKPELQNITDIPYAVIVFCTKSKYFCSGTLVHEEWVLTSAHCLYNMYGTLVEDDESIVVVAGANSIYFTTQDVTSGAVQIRKSKIVIIHKNYSWSENFIYDLVLIQVSERFTMTDYVDIAFRQDVSTKNKVSGHHDDSKLSDDAVLDCHIYGYGRVKGYEHLDFRLKRQTYKVSKHCHCLEKIRSKRSLFNVLKKKNIFLCDELFTEDIGLCDGDNGGQLVCEGADRSLRGIATTAVHYKSQERCVLQTDQEMKECGQSALNVFTDLCAPSVRSWIRDTLKDLYVDSCKAGGSLPSYFELKVLDFDEY